MSPGGQEKFFLTTTIHFTPEMGRRLTYARRYGCKKHWGASERSERVLKNATCTCLKQSDLAKQLGVSQKTISKWETGETQSTSVLTGVFRSALKEHFMFILTGEGRSKYKWYQPLTKEGQDFD